MPRQRMLPGLAILLGVLAASAWLAWWAVREGHLPLDGPSAGWAELRGPLTGATLLTAGLAIALRGVAATVARRSHDHRAAQGIAHVQTLVALVLAIAVLTYLAGDFSTTLVSLGLVGFGLTLALQRPILALAGWGTIVAGRMFREGDRIQVGDLRGDVIAITLFTTKLWELGKEDSASPGRPSGRILTVSNAVFLEQPVANATSDTPIVFDEFVATVPFEADLDLARSILERVGGEVLDPKRHEDMALRYRRLTRGLTMEAYFPDKPRILMESRDSWMELRLRYLTDARDAAQVQTRLTEAWTAATRNVAAIPQAYPRVQRVPPTGGEPQGDEDKAPAAGPATVRPAEPLPSASLPAMPETPTAEAAQATTPDDARQR